MIITHFYYICDKNKVGYLRRQPTSNVLSNNSYYEKQIFHSNKVADIHIGATYGIINNNNKE